LKLLLKEQFSASALKTLLVCGKAHDKGPAIQIDNCSVVPFLTANELNQAICAADVVISRSGYSSVMDLATLKESDFHSHTRTNRADIFSGILSTKKHCTLATNNLILNSTQR
jgi:hypothetical protein